MNKKIAIIGLAVIAVLAAAAYFIFGGAKKDDYCSVIPQDAIMVSRIAPIEFLEKNNLEIEELAERAGAPARFVKMAMSYIKGSGIDITRPFYLFADAKANIGGVIALNDAKEFTSLLETEGQMTVIKDGGLNYVQLGNGDAFICYDSQKALFYGSPKNGKIKMENIEKMMNQKADESVLNEKLYEQLIDAKKSFAVNVEYKACFDLIKGFAAAFSSPADMAAFNAATMVIPDCNTLLTWDIEDDKAQFCTDVYPNSDKAEKEYEELISKMTPIDGALCDKGLDTPLAWMIFNFPGKSIREIVKQIPGMEDALKQLPEGIDLYGTLEGLSGDVSLALDSNLEGDNPEFLLMAKPAQEPEKLMKTVDELMQFAAKNNSDINFIKDDANNFHLTQKVYEYDWQNYGDFEYAALDEYTDDEPAAVELGPKKIDKGMKDMAFIQLNNGVIALSNAKNLVAKAGKESSAMKAYKSDMKGCYFYAVVDFQTIADVVSTKVESDKQAMVIKSIRNFKDLVIKAEARHAEVTCSTQSGKKFMDVVLDIASNAVNGAFK